MQIGVRRAAASNGYTKSVAYSKATPSRSCFRVGLTLTLTLTLTPGHPNPNPNAKVKPDPLLPVRQWNR